MHSTRSNTLNSTIVKIPIMIVCTFFKVPIGSTKLWFVNFR
jgi:hypothetical protein